MAARVRPADRAIHRLAYVDAERPCDADRHRHRAGPVAFEPHSGPRRHRCMVGGRGAAARGGRGFALVLDTRRRHGPFKGPIATGVSAAAIAPDGERARRRPPRGGRRHRAGLVPTTSRDRTRARPLPDASPPAEHGAASARPSFSPDGDWILLPWPRGRPVALRPRRGGRVRAAVAEISRQLDPDRQRPGVVPARRRLVLLRQARIIEGWPSPPPRPPADARDAGDRAARRRRLGVRDQVGRRAGAGVPRRGRDPGLRAAAARTPRPATPSSRAWRGARRPRRRPRRRGRGVRRRGPSELPDAPAADGPLAARDDPPPVAGGPGDVRRVRPARARRRVALLAEPYERRRELLAGLELDDDPGGRPRTMSAAGTRSSTPPAPRAWRESCASASAAPYRPGKRSRGLAQDPRSPRSQELVIGGYMPGEGGRAGRVGSLLVGYWDATPEEARSLGRPQRLVYAGGVGTGFTDAMLERLIGLLRPLAHRRGAVRAGRGPAREVQGEGARARRGARLGRAASWSASSSSPSGRARARCASPRSRACATTRTPARSCARARRRKIACVLCGQAGFGRYCGVPSGLHLAMSFTPVAGL